MRDALLHLQSTKLPRSYRDDSSPFIGGSCLSYLSSSRLMKYVVLDETNTMSTQIESLSDLLINESINHSCWMIKSIKHIVNDQRVTCCWQQQQQTVQWISTILLLTQCFWITSLFLSPRTTPTLGPVQIRWSRIGAWYLRRAIQAVESRSRLRHLVENRSKMAFRWMGSNNSRVNGHWLWYNVKWPTNNN